MARIAIRFVDHDGKATDDFIEVLPVVAVNIHVGITYQSTPKEILDTVKLMKRVDALIDTGSNTTMIGRTLAGSQAPLRNVPSQNQAEPGIGSVYGALVQIEGLDKAYPIEVGLANLILASRCYLGEICFPNIA
ncbi:hypothetical protein [Bradyrhizobium sp. USDA 223]|uniref:hypothetical protein n=1 Tax=Bradyrhizobium sp. USDA 223 TaxID=3156306 RepID=UPI0038368D6A